MYAPGVLALTFDWEYFDAVVFLINYNEGYPMSIPDMAAAFAFNGTANATNAAAIVHCDEPARNANAWSQLSNDEDADSCYDAKFYFDREEVVLPVINETASRVYDRIIPNPGGDCRILDTSSQPMAFELYNITVTGMPVSIACGITPAIDLDGVAVPLGLPPSPSSLPSGADALLSTGNFTNSSAPYAEFSNLTGISNTPPPESPANESTNGVGGAYIAPPPPEPFAIPFNASNSACFSGPSTGGSEVCFPNGTFVPQKGLFGYSTTNVTAMTLPRGVQVRINLVTQQSVRGGGHAVVSNYTGPVKFTERGDQGWYLNFGHFGGGTERGKMDVCVDGGVVDVPPAVCFWSEKGFGGEVFCLGAGGGNLTGVESSAVVSVR